jgi:hypothetical protein
MMISTDKPSRPVAAQLPFYFRRCDNLTYN